LLKFGERRIGDPTRGVPFSDE